MWAEHRTAQAGGQCLQGQGGKGSEAGPQAAQQQSVWVAQGQAGGIWVPGHPCGLCQGAASSGKGLPGHQAHGLALALPCHQSAAPLPGA